MVHGLSLGLLDRLDDRLPVWLVRDMMDGCHVEMMVTAGEAYDWLAGLYGLDRVAVFRVGVVRRLPYVLVDGVRWTVPVAPVDHGGLICLRSLTGVTVEMPVARVDARVFPAEWDGLERGVGFPRVDARLVFSADDGMLAFTQ